MGTPPSETPRWRRVGGALCLDFVNTMDWRLSDHATELLPDYASLVAWTTEAGHLDPAQADALLAAETLQPGASAQVYGDAMAFREALFTVLSQPGPPEPAALASVNAHIAALPAPPALTTQDGRLVWDWPPDAPPLPAPLWPVLWSAALLLTGPDRARVRLCEATGCGWLFLPAAHGQPRRWCSMATCGNRQKARRHYRRSRGDSA